MGYGNAEGDDPTLQAGLADTAAVGNMGAFVRLACCCSGVYTGNAGRYMKPHISLPHAKLAAPGQIGATAKRELEGSSI